MGIIGWGIVGWTIDTIAHEAMLFTAVGFLIGGIDDLAIDLIWLWHKFQSRLAPLPDVADLGEPVAGRIAIFVAAWQESAVIGAMLRTALARIAHDDYCIFVGAYPNDPPTIEAIAAVARHEPRVRLVIGPRDGPTTKADNLNVLWRALQRDDRSRGATSRAVVIHDAEDVVHADELAVHAALLARHGVVQIPVVPLIDRAARFVSGHYADEFAESHARQLVVRAVVGAGLPLAGVGCAIRLDALEAIAAAYGDPFDASSLTEDYELGLRLGGMGLAGTFARVCGRDGTMVATRAFFPATIGAAVTQKARWMTGIALAGWDRIGWSRPFHLADHWMRMRDRRAPLAIMILAIAYFALAAASLSFGLHTVLGTPPPGLSLGMSLLLWINLGILVWRAAMRVWSTTRLYGWREGFWSLPRIVVANVIALLAIQRALVRYVRLYRGEPLRWDKTVHVFPIESGAGSTA